MLQGFLLGLSTGATCLAYCSPVLVPYLLGEGKSIHQTTLTLSQFMLGRLFGYLLFAVFAWLSGRYLTTLTDQSELFLGIIYILLAAILLWYALTTPSAPCALRSLHARINRLTLRHSKLLPLLMGLLTGLNLCPPFLLAFAAATETPTLEYSLLFFLTFFLGTSLYFLPLPFLGTFKRYPQLKNIGKLAAALMSVFYVYTGILMIIGGFAKS